MTVTVSVIMMRVIMPYNVRYYFLYQEERYDPCYYYGVIVHLHGIMGVTMATVVISVRMLMRVVV